MTQRVPVDSKRADWPRLVADAANALITANDTKTGQITALEGDVTTLQSDLDTAELAITALQTATDWSLLADYADDTAAASGGVVIGELYRTGSVVKVRVA